MMRGMNIAFTCPRLEKIMSIRIKLIAASLGPVVILLVVGLISIRTITESSKTIERIFKENYDSVAAGLNMKNSIERTHRVFETFLWEEALDRPYLDSAIAEFEKNLKFQQGNVTLPGEQERTDKLVELWGNYRTETDDFLKIVDSGDTRREFFRTHLLPRGDEVRDAAQKIIDINLNNMVSADGQVRRQAGSTNHTVMVLVASGVLFGIIFVAIIGPSIARPISTLTRSVRDIQQGNLDLFVKVNSGDEIGQLAAAFNEMTASLREFRRSDRARLIRTQMATLAALNSLSDAIAICSPTGSIELSNDAAQRLFSLKTGANIETVEDKRLADLFARARREKRPIRNKGYDSAIQIFREGEEFFYLPEAIPIFDEERRFIGVTLVLSDVTRLRKLDEVKSGLISTVSHELKTPLTSIRLAAHALLSEKVGELNPAQAEIVAVAREDADRLHRIIENLLDIGRMESGQTSLELIPINTEKVLLNAVEEMRPAFADRGVALVLDFPEATPSVLADSLRLEIVLANLLTNALKHTPPGGQVKVSANAEGKLVNFSVEDTGPGISEEYLPFIFEKFFRVPGSEQQGDSGLGLAIVKEIVEAHGGRISAASKPGQGIKFLFSLKSGSVVEKTRTPAEF